jgi:hypothetical protein
MWLHIRHRQRGERREEEAGSDAEHDHGRQHVDQVVAGNRDAREEQQPDRHQDQPRNQNRARTEAQAQPR